MPPRTASKNVKADQEEPPPKYEGGEYELKDVVVGAKLYVEKINSDTGEWEQRLAEVLSIREKRQNRLHLLQEIQEKGEHAVKEKEPELDFYVHYCEFNKRLDEWVPSAKLVLSLIHI